MGLAATFTHLLLWNRNDLRAAWSWMNKESIRQMLAEFDWRFWRADGKREYPPDKDADPHYLEMLKVCPIFISDGNRCLSSGIVSGRPEQLVWRSTCVCIHHSSRTYLQSRINSPLVSARGKSDVSFGLISASFLSSVGGASLSPVYWHPYQFSVSAHFSP
jgi:hypothetical protein